MNGPTEEDTDRLSDLPEEILHHILSFLNMKQVGETCVLSKRWRKLWASLPVLNFDKELVESLNSTEDPTAFRCFVAQALLQRSNNYIQKVHFYCPEVNHIDSWIVYLRNRNVEEISIVMGYTCLNNRELQFLLRDLFTCTSLKVLELHLINVVHLKCILPPRTINLPMLQTLLLHGLSLDDTFDKLFYACPILESLTIKNCSIHSSSHLNISSSKLRQLVIDNNNNDCGGEYCLPTPRCAVVKVCAPNLLFFCCKDNILIDYSLENLSSLVKADILLGREDGLSAKEKEREEHYTKSTMEVLRALQNVTTLTLSGPCSTFQAFSESDAWEGTQFCNLRCFKVCAKKNKSKNSNWIKGVTCLLKISPNIETVSLTGEMSDSTYIGEYEEAVLSLGTLKHLKFVEFKNAYGGIGGVNNFKFLENLVKNVVALEKLVIVFIPMPISPGKERFGEGNIHREELLALPTTPKCGPLNLISILWHRFLSFSEL